MKFTHREPTDWKELQDFIADYLITAGYKATTPFEIDTARGKVEVDVYIESPYELVKHIVCECKWWNTPVTQEKIHAFRTVVQDIGAELGIIISKNGYQSGAIETAKYSNVRLETWDSFLEIIKGKWLDNKLWAVKRMAARVMSFADEYDYKSEYLNEKEYQDYKATCKSVASITEQCMLIRKSDLTNNTTLLTDFLIDQQYLDIEQYLNHLTAKLNEALDVLEKLSVKPDKTKRYISTMKFFLAEDDV